MGRIVTTAFVREMYATGKGGDYDAALAEIDLFLESWAMSFAQDAVNEIIDSLPSAPDPGNPFMYNPWEDESVDPGNLEDVVHAAVSRGWETGKFDMIQHVKRSVEEYMDVTWRKSE